MQEQRVIDMHLIYCQGAGQDQLGIFIVSLQKDGPAAKVSKINESNRA